MKLSLFPEEKVQEARAKVAQWWRENAQAARRADQYAPHVTEKQKLTRLRDALVLADEIETGMHDTSFWAWQRIYAELTGESIAFLPASAA